MSPPSDRVATETGGAVSLYGHPYGAVCALGAAPLSRNLAPSLSLRAGVPAFLADWAQAIEQELHLSPKLSHVDTEVVGLICADWAPHGDQ